jgi:acetyl-CoA carboxylase biotin carboxyl carrier protein
MVSSTNLSDKTNDKMYVCKAKDGGANMDIEKIFSLMEKAEKSSFSKIEIQTGDVKVCLERQTAMAAAPVPVTLQAAEETVKAPASQEKKQEPKNDDLLLAPISGVFYVAKEPGAEPFVKEGQHVRKGDPVCIIEAMKMMNEICAPKSGVIERVFVKDSHAISAGDALFAYVKES